MGATATTFEMARDEDGALFVCKRLLPRFVGDGAARAMLESEARVLGKLDGRGAPRLVDAGEDQHGPFLVTQRIDAPSLDAPGRPDDRVWLAAAARAAFHALALVHEATDDGGPLGVVHADLSPGNVLVPRSLASLRSGPEAPGPRAATIIDFAHAAWRDAPAAGGGAFRGTLLYAAPELARGEPTDARCDVFALAASILHAASGAPPRVAETPSAMLLEAGERPLDDYAHRAAAALDPDTAAALTRCVAFARGDRPAEARAVFGARA